MSLTNKLNELNLSESDEQNKITHLICEITNEKLSEIVLKLFSEDKYYSDYSLMYLADIIVSESTLSDEQQGLVNIKLLGNK